MKGKTIINLIFSLALISLLGPGFSARANAGLPANRSYDWNTAGYQRDPSDNLPVDSDYQSIVTMPAPHPTQDSSANWDYINEAIQEAADDNANPGRTLIQFQDGLYNIDKPIIVDQDHGNVTFRGSGNTTILLEPPAENSLIFLIRGDEDDVIYDRNIKDYIPSKKTIVFDPTPISIESNSSNSTTELSDPLCTLQVGDYLRIKVHNNPLWDDNSSSNDILGQVVKIVARNTTCTEFTLQDDIDFIWDLAESVGEIPYATKILPVSEVGIENLTIRASTYNTYGVKTIVFQRAINSWVKDTELVDAININISIRESQAIEIRRNYIHHAQLHDGGGQGYGVAISEQSTYCLVIDNIFQYLRHSMQVNSSANRNVFAYNYSRDQHDNQYDEAGDISLHGDYPFANLFEGNRIDRIIADKYWGSNGPYNTFLRNFSYYGLIRLEWTNDANVIGNEAKLVRIPKTNADNLIDQYGMVDYNPSGYPITLSHLNWEPTHEESGGLADVSYLYSSRPSFISSDFSWPPMGPKTSSNGAETTQNIPARKRFFEEIAHQSSYATRWPTEDGKYLAVNTSGDWITVFNTITGEARKIYSADDLFYDNRALTHMVAGDFNGDIIEDVAVNANGDLIAIFNPLDGVANRWYSKDTVFDGDEPIHHMIAGDFDGNGSDDIAVNGDGDLITVFSPIRSFVWFRSVGLLPGSPSIKHMISGDFDGDGIDEIALNTDGDWITVFGLEPFALHQPVVLYSGDGLFADNPSIEHMIPGDFNGDGIDEIALNRYNTDDITVFNVRSGNPEILFSKNDLFTNSSKFKHMISGDFNGDNVDELAVNFYVRPFDDDPIVASVAADMDGYYDWITVFNVAEGSMDILFSNADAFPGNPSITHMICGDFNGDGIDDIAANSTADSISVFNPRNGTPSFWYLNSSLFTDDPSLQHFIGGYFQGYSPSFIGESEDPVDDKIIVDVILGIETDPELTELSDLNGDGRVNALDIQMSVNKQLEMEAEE
jgi:hypothetical protein